MNGGSIFGNSASNSNGGGVQVTLYSTFIMNDGSIHSNTAGSGGGVYVNANSTTNPTIFRIKGGIVYGNAGPTPNTANLGSALNSEITTGALCYITYGENDTELPTRIDNTITAAGVQTP